MIQEIHYGEALYKLPDDPFWYLNTKYCGVKRFDSYAKATAYIEFMEAKRLENRKEWDAWKAEGGRI